MARRNSNRSSVYASAITNRRLLDTVINHYRIPFSRPFIAPITDRRTFHPAPTFRPVRVSGAPGHRLKVPHPFKRQLPFGLAFEAPRSIAICQRRRARRQVLHAFRLTGKGARARVRKRDQWSDISC